MTHLLVVAALLAHKSAPPAPKKPAELHLEVVHDRAGDVDRLDARLDAPLIAAAVAAGPDGARFVVVLAEAAPEPAPSPSPAPCDPSAEIARPRRLLVLDPKGDGAWRLVRSDIPSDAYTVTAADLDGDGVDEILIGRRGRVDLVPRSAGGGLDGPLVPALEDPALSGEWLSFTGKGSSLRLAVGAVGALRLYGPEAGGRTLRRVGAAPMPFRVAAPRGTLSLSSPWTWRARGSPKGPWITEPEVLGKDRIRFHVLDPENPSAEARSVECWARLPGPERILDGGFVLLDGTPAVVVTTTTAEKLKLLGARRVRVYRPAPDRTRSGSAPILAAETNLNLWQSTSPRVRDVDGDGRDDLVLPYWKGLKSTIVAFDVFLRKADGSFEDSPRTSEIDVEDGDRSVLELDRDVDGDGIPDLVLRTRQGIEIHQGFRDTKAGKRLFSKDPWRLAAVPDGLAEPGDVGMSIGAGGFSTWAVAPRSGVPEAWGLEPGKPPAIGIAAVADRDRRGRVVIFRF